AGAPADAPRPGDAARPKTALEHLAAPERLPAPSADADAAERRDHAARVFDLKLGREDADTDGLPWAVRAAASLFRLDAPRSRLAPVPPGESQPEPEGVETHATIKRDPPPAPIDDGGGPGYATREVPFNGQVFPSVAFRPNVAVDALIVKAIDSAKTSVKVSLYEFNSRAILKALQAARKRGVNVQVVLDYRAVFPHNEPGSEYKRRRSEQIWALVRDGFDIRVTRTATEYGINHNKFLVADGKLAEFGSYNWSYTSEMNHYENVVFTAEADRVAALEGYWQYLWDRGVPEPQAKGHEWPSVVPAPPAATVFIDFNGTKLPAWVFTPGDSFEDTVVAALDAARTSVDYAMFSPRSTRVTEALVRAHQRGVKVRALIDESQSKAEYFKPFADYLAFHGVETKVLAGPNGAESDFPLAEKMHNKFMVLDGRLVQTGSANHTKRASIDNYENAFFLEDKTDAAAFSFVFKHMFGVARPHPAPARAEIPTDEQLARDILDPPAKPPVPPQPEEPPLPAARTFTFNGRQYPSRAFRPYDPVVSHVVAAIDSAKKSVKIAIYQFDQREVLDALQAAKKRGVAVQVVLDRAHVYTTGTSHEGGPRKPRPMIVELVKSGFDLLLVRGQRSGIQHNKFVVVDDLFLETGSYNFTKQSEDDHYESVIFTMDKGRVGLYRRYFNYLRDAGEEVDFAKLEEILTRTEAVPEEGDLEPEAARRAEGERESKFPAPPTDASEPVSLHGETFPRTIFSPQGGIEEAVIRAIDAAQTSLEVAMFSFYSRPIAEAIKRAFDRGVKTSVLLDRSQTALSKIDDWLAWHGVDVRLISGPDDERDPLYQKMHNKFMVVDGLMVEMGSFNYSPNAENNSFENANFLDDESDVAGFVAYFQRMFGLAVKARKPRREPVWKEDAKT
ncbi:MAG: phospholipase D-like domain-containing protein, partial [Elusimicrobiota bacterium]|nr:phospholipase D-like domain-containing protein [Elusimicrobiota bacterium]